MMMKRNRILYSGLTLVVMVLGLTSRRLSAYLPLWLNSYLGDVLWALMVFLIFGLVFNRRSTKQVALMALTFSVCIEISQLYHSQWIDEIRKYKLGGLVLGFGFLWSDIFSYSAGILTGYFIEAQYLAKGREGK